MLPHIPLQSIRGTQLFVYLLKSSLVLWAETTRPGPVPHETTQASTALGSPAQPPGLGGTASYPERVGSFPCNEIDEKRTKLLSTPAHPLTAMTAKRGMGTCRPQAREEKGSVQSAAPRAAPPHHPTSGGGLGSPHHASGRRAGRQWESSKGSRRWRGWRELEKQPQNNSLCV